MKNTIKSTKQDEAAQSPEGKPSKGSARQKKAPAEKKKRKLPSFSLPGWMKDPRTRKISGGLLIFISIFLFLSAVSFIFTGQHDLRLILDDDTAGDGIERYRNLLGLTGAHAGFYLMHKGLGLGSLFFPFLLGLYGIRISFKKSLLPLAKTTRLSLIGAVYIPLLVGFIFHSGNVEEGLSITCNDSLVGSGGIFLLETFKYRIGGFGTFMILLFVAASAVIFNFNHLLERLHLPAWLMAWFQRSSAADGRSNEDSPSEKHTTEAAHNPVAQNRPKNEVAPAPPWEDDSEEDDDNGRQASDAADDVLNELINERKPTEIILTGEPEDEEEPPHRNDHPAVEAEVSQEESELEIEMAGADDELSEDEIDDKVQQFGLFDPKLDLSRYELPNIDLLEVHGSGQVEINKDELEINKNRIVDTLNNYNIEISKIKATVGPTVTLYEIIPAPGVRISKIKNLEDDIALSLAALGIRIIAPIPGKGTIGIEVPNSSPNVVAMRSLIASDKFQNSDMELPIAIGKTISNETFTFDLAKMPHLLMAGATGQGKSVGLNAMLVSLLYKKHPSQLKFVLVDPKKVELTLFNKIERHFLAKLPGEDEAIITDTSKVVTTLNSLCVEMDDRYEMLKNAHCRNIKEYNKKFVQRKLNPENGHRYLPYIVLVVDEFADLIMTAGKEVETPIARLAQLARAIGIHLIIATQRPSVNIITGTIKANFPARIAFRVTSKIDSRTILDAGGADQLIGRGDMLFSTGSDLIRIQCGFVDTPEVEQITEFIGSQQGYPDAFLLPEYKDEGSGEMGTLGDEDRDELFEEAARVIVMHQQGSTSLLQRKLKLGYNRAGRLVDQLEAAGIIGPFEGSKARKVLIPDEATLEQFLQS